MEITFHLKTNIIFSRLRKWDYRTKNNSKKRSLTQAFIILDSVSNKMGLPENAKEHTAYIYRKASDNGIIKGNSIESMLSASAYAACKQLGIPRSLEETVKATNTDRKTLSRTYRRLVQKLDLDVGSQKIDYVSKIANLVNVSERIKRTSSKILRDAKEDNIHVGKNPLGLAAAAVYLSAIGSGRNISMATFSRKSHISTVTIRKIVRLLRPFASKYIESIDVSS